MSGRRRVSSIRRAAIALTVAWIAGCGQRGAPLPPLRRNPQRIAPVQISQRGATVEITATAPRISVDGTGLDVLDVELTLDTLAVGSTAVVPAETQSARAAPGEALRFETPLPGPGTQMRATLRARDGRHWSAPSVSVALTVVEPPEPPRDLVALLLPTGIELSWKSALMDEDEASAEPRPSPSPGDAGSRADRDPASAESPGERAEPPSAAEPADERDASGEPTPTPSPAAPVLRPPPRRDGVARRIPVPPPDVEPPAATAPGSETDAEAEQAPPEAGPTAELEPDPEAAPGVQEPAAEASAVETGPRPLPIRVYRRGEYEDYDRPLMAQPTANSPHVDATVEVGDLVCYVARTVATPQPLVESEPTPEVCLRFRDIAPPRAVVGLSFVEAAGGIELTWTPSTSPDVARYRIYRRPDAGVPETVAEVSADVHAYLDAAPVHGALYWVTALDADENESEASEPLRVRLR